MSFADLSSLLPTWRLPAKTLAEFVTWAKAQPEGILYASPGVGTTPHLCGALFMARHGIKGTHVPFRGASQIVPSMMKGDVHFAIDNLPSYVSFIDAGQLRALATTTASRWPTQPSVPTMAEGGTPDIVVTSWAAFIAPKRTPGAIIEKVAQAIREISAEPGMTERLAKLGANPLSSTPEQVTERAVRERPMWQEMIKVSGARLD